MGLLKHDVATYNMLIKLIQFGRLLPNMGLKRI
jgi:hypothetical protein